MSIADVLRSLMEATLIDGKPISENQLARETDVPQPTIHRVLVGESKDPKSNTLKKLASRWNITVAQLRGEEPLPPHLMTAAEGGEQIQEVGQGPRKGKEIKIRLSEEDLELLILFARRLGVPLETLTRSLIKGALQQQAEPFREMLIKSLTDEDRAFIKRWIEAYRSQPATQKEDKAEYSTESTS